MPELEMTLASETAEEKPPVEETPVAAEEVAETESASGADEEPEEGKEEPPKPKGKGGFQRKIDKLTREKYEMQERVSQLEREIRERQAGREAAPKDEPKKPKMDDYPDLESYVEALSLFNANQKIAEFRRKEAQEAEQEATREIFDSYNQRVKEFREEHDDFDEVVGRDDLKISEAVQLAILEMDNGPEIAYYLGQHEDVCEELSAMRPLSAVIAIGKLAASLAKPSPKEKPKSDAPAPIKPVSGSAKSTVALDEMPVEDYIKLRNKEARKR